jgi:agmatinase
MPGMNARRPGESLGSGDGSGPTGAGVTGTAPQPVGQLDPLAFPRYTGLATFARLPRLEDVPGYDVAVVGVPFDTGVTYRPGARFGPSHIRQASRLLRPYNPVLDVEPFGRHQVVDAGDVACNPFDILEALSQIEREAGRLAASGQRLLSLGGDHTVALPLLRAVAALHGPVALVHFDAHLDTWPTYFGAEYTHGSMFRRAAEEGLFLPGCSAHVGIRGSLYTPDDLAQDAGMGFKVFSCPEIDDIGAQAVVERLREQVGDRPTYLSIDIDVLDPAFAPATGTPETAGPGLHGVVLAQPGGRGVLHRHAGHRQFRRDRVPARRGRDRARHRARIAARRLHVHMGAAHRRGSAAAGPHPVRQVRGAARHADVAVHHRRGSLSLQAAGVRIMRPLVAVIVTVVAFGLTLWLQSGGNLASKFTNLVLFISYWDAPFAAVVIVDWWQRRGQVDVSRIVDFKRLASGWSALTALVAGFLAAVPFMNTTLFVGPVASGLLHGGDLAYFVGFAVGGLAYAGLSRVEARRSADTGSAAVLAGIGPASTAEEPRE